MALMTDRDAAFLWESQALRESPQRGDVADRPTTPAAATPNWATLREAHYQTGIPIETLRKWARRGAVSSYLDESEIGVRRMVRMDAVRSRAEDLGRPIAPMARPPVNKPVPSAQIAPPVPQFPPAAPPEETDGRPPAEAMEQKAEAVPDVAAPSAPEGTMIVPIAAWDKMLMQLGNLHEAGQQLAEARERAAKAETEAKFLRERLGEFRRDRQRSRETIPSPPAEPELEPTEVAPAAVPVVSEPPVQAEKLWRYIYRGWRQRRR